MISEFQQLSQKIEQLALLVQDLRSENAQLRLEVVSLRSDNQDANQRIELAYQRVAALLAQLPPDPEEIAAADGMEEEVA